MADNSQKIAQLQEILDSGASSVTVDGITTSFDHDSIRQRISDLIAEDEALASKKPIVSTILLNNQRSL